MLGWIGRQRTRAIPALVLVGIGVPPLGAALRPYVTEAVLGLLCIAFLRIDTHALRACLSRPAIVVGASAWTAFAVPAVVAVLCATIDLRGSSPDLHLALMLQALASPMMAAPAFAAMMGLDATLVLTTLIASSAVTPFSATLIASAIGLELSLSATALGARLLAILSVAAIVGLGVRRALGTQRVERYRDEIDGVNVVLLLVFVAAVMSDVGPRFLAEPIGTALLTALAFAVYLAVLGLSYCVFAAIGRPRAFALGMMTSQRNMGLMVAATEGALPDLAWLYIAVSQFPIYLSPWMLQPLSRKLAKTRSSAREAA